MISIIAAVSKKGIIGKNGEIPWHLPDDFKRFKKITEGHTVIMGRKTYESIIKKLGKALPNRKSVVITSQYNFTAPNCTILHSANEAIKLFLSGKEEVFVIGGSEIYDQFLPVANKLYITEVDMDFEGDAVFPSYDKNDWMLSLKEHHEKDEKHLYEFDYIELIKK